MKPYVESGQAAQRKLERGPEVASTERQRVMANLCGLKQVINTLGVMAILVVPLVGFLAQSAFTAMWVAVFFLLFIIVLELMERGVKRELAALDEQSNSKPSA